MSERTLFSSNMQRSSKMIDFGRKLKTNRELGNCRYKIRNGGDTDDVGGSVALYKLGESGGQGFSPVWKSL